MTPRSRFFLAGIALVLGCIALGIVFRVLSPRSIENIISSRAEEEHLSSFYSNEADYAAAFAEAEPTAVRSVFAAVTSHHFLAKSLIARTMTGIDQRSIKTVVLISPDHFNAVADENILGVTTTATWDTPFGEVANNPGQIEALTTTERIQLSRRHFLAEHGIYTIVPFIKKQFPDATVVPIILRQSDDYSTYAEFGKSLRQFFEPSETLVIVSSDFSHNKTPEEAKAADAVSISALQSKNIKDVDQIDSDCKVCMATLYGYLDGLNTSFELVENKDSFDLSGQSPQIVTSYVSGYFVNDDIPELRSPALPTQAPQTSDIRPIRLLFGGDLMFDRNIRLKMQQSGFTFPLQDLVPLFNQYDVVIANLEGPVTNFPSKSVGSTPGSTANFIFTFPAEIAQTLYDQKLRVANLGNNHIQNFGSEGVVQTKQLLSSAQVTFFGDTGEESESKDRVTIIEQQGKKIGFVSYNQFTSQGMEHALADIEYLRPQVDVLILYTHWGNEYVPTANEVITSQAHTFIEKGVDLLIGSHPHVIQNTEVYKGKTIYYSLGNMVFDQYFRPEVQEGLLVGVEIDPNTLEMRFSDYKIQLKPTGQTLLKPTE